MAHKDEVRKNLGLPETTLQPGSRLLSTVKHIPGIHSSYVYMSLETSVFWFHKEDNALSSANDVVCGAPKLWLTIYAEDCERFEALFCEALSIKYTPCAQFVRHYNRIIPPKILRQWGIRFDIRLQLAGHRVMVKGNTYHGGFNLGPNLAEAINYADPRWTSPPLYISCKPKDPLCPDKPILASDMKIDKPRPLNFNERFEIPKKKQHGDKQHSDKQPLVRRSTRPDAKPDVRQGFKASQKSLDRGHAKSSMPQRKKHPKKAKPDRSDKANSEETGQSSTAESDCSDEKDDNNADTLCHPNGQEITGTAKIGSRVDQEYLPKENVMASTEHKNSMDLSNPGISPNLGVSRGLPTAEVQSDAETTKPSGVLAAEEESVVGSLQSALEVRVPDIEGRYSIGQDCPPSNMPPGEQIQYWISYLKAHSSEVCNEPSIPALLKLPGAVQTLERFLSNTEDPEKSWLNDEIIIHTIRHILRKRDDVYIIDPLMLAEAFKSKDSSSLGYDPDAKYIVSKL